MVSSTRGAISTAMAMSEKAPVRFLKNSWMGTWSASLTRELAMTTKMDRPQPERRVAQDGERDIEKQKDQREPKNVGADDELWIGLQQLLELLLREVPVC